MKIIAKLVDRIDDELEGAKTYTKLAHKYKIEYPRLADKFIELAEAEMNHMKILHGEVTRLIEDVRQREGEPPAEMMAIYNYEHGKHVEKAAMVRQMMEEYRNS